MNSARAVFSKKPKQNHALYSLEAMGGIFKGGAACKRPPLNVLFLRSFFYTSKKSAFPEGEKRKKSISAAEARHAEGVLRSSYSARKIKNLSNPTQ